MCGLCAATSTRTRRQNTPSRSRSDKSAPSASGSPETQRRLGTVERHDPQPIAAPLERLRRALGRQPDHGQRALAGGPRQQPAAMADHLCRVVDRQRAGDARGRHLAHAVADDRIGDDTPRSPERGQRDLDGKEQPAAQIELVDPRRRRLVCRRTRRSRSSRATRWIAAAHASSRARNTGSDSSRPRHARAIDEPWPEQTNTRPAGRRSGAAPTRDAFVPLAGRTRPASCAAVRASARRRPRRDVRDGAPPRADAVRLGSGVRVVDASSCCTRSRAARAGRPRPMRAAASSLAGLPLTPLRRTTWQLVPPKPNELTPARHGRRRSGQGAARRSARRGRSASKRMCGLGVSKCRLRRNLTPCRSDSATLIRPAIPAAASRWPMLVFTEPIAQRPIGGPAGAEHARRARRPRSDRRAACRCRAPRRSRRRRARRRRRAQAIRSICSCACGFGAVRPLLKPSLLTRCRGSRSRSSRRRASACGRAA